MVRGRFSGTLTLEHYKKKHYEKLLNINIEHKQNFEILKCL